MLTKHGYFLTYKAVKDFDEPKAKEVTKKTPKAVPVVDELTKLVNEKFNQIKNVWKKAAKDFTVYQKDEKYFVAETKTFKGDASTIGVLSDLYLSLNPVTDPVPTTELVVGKPVVEVPTKTYTDKHTGTMRIKLGQPVKMERKKCNGDPAVECSMGLHCGSVIYVQTFANQTDTILSCLVNPAHVVAIPKYDNTKMRVSEYFPLGVVDNFKTKKVNEQQAFFESDYIAYEKEDLENQIKLIKSNQLPIEASITSKKEERSMVELLKIIESRLIDIK